jgi:hypothetical protein
MSLLQKLGKLRSDLAQAAQLVVDEWIQNEEGFNEDLGNGGVCDLVSQAMADVIGNSVVDVDIVDGGHDGDDHAWLIIVDNVEAVGVDIPPGVYETGGGYSWKKIENVEIEPTDVVLWNIDRRDIVASSSFDVKLVKHLESSRADRLSFITVKTHTSSKWAYEGKFSFQGRTYDVKIKPDGQGAVVYQKSPKCLFAKDGDEWFLQAGSKAIFDTAMSHLRKNKIASDSDDIRLQPGPAFHLQPDGTWLVENVPPAMAKDARFSGFLAIEGYWCAVFELNGEEWAQKAAGDVPEAEAKLASIARRVAGNVRHIGPGSYVTSHMLERIAGRIAV